MKIKKSISFHCSILLMFCQAFWGIFLGNGAVFAAEEGLTEEKMQTIATHCEKIKESLRLVQREDSVVRTHLGPYYNTVLEKFMKPLNLRLVENNLTEQRLFDNQRDFAVEQDSFRNDYRDYQMVLGELVAMDCSSEPEKFYAKLETVRAARKIVATDVSGMRKKVAEQIEVVKALREKL